MCSCVQWRFIELWQWQCAVPATVVPAVAFGAIMMTRVFFARIYSKRF